ncbi:MAG: phage holin, LLH family [Firmicutes bacterium]|nr:phage holin, LLH family [Bacillota bacterium]
MEFIKLFISEYGTTILYAVLTALAGYIGIFAKKLYTKYVNDKTKQAVAKTVVQAVEQIYKDLHGEEKLNKALEAASEMLAEKGITITDLEMRMLIEAALAEFNRAFEKENTDGAEDTTEGAAENNSIGFTSNN